jgi:hypothetical protein
MGNGLGLMEMSGPVEPWEGWRGILGGNNGRTWFSGFAPPLLLLSLPLLATQIKMGSGSPEMESVRGGNGNGPPSAISGCCLFPSGQGQRAYEHISISRYFVKGTGPDIKSYRVLFRRVRESSGGRDQNSPALDLTAGSPEVRPSPGPIRGNPVTPINLDLNDRGLSFPGTTFRP